MKFTMTKIAAGLLLSATAMSAQAVMVNGNTLSIDTGSFFTMGGGTSVNAPGFDGQFITGFNGLVLGTTQTATGSHSGTPNGSESPNIDNAWAFFGNTGMHLSTSNTNVLTASGNTATVDFSGWAVSWNGIAVVPMGSGAWNGNANGVAMITCGVDCGNGDTYTLDYSATVPAGDPSNFGNTKYLLHLTGTVAAVPEASTYGMMLAGLGLVGFAVRRRKLVA